MACEMENMEQPAERIIKAKRVKDGFTFKLSIDHIIEQTLLKQYKSPLFRKSTIQIEDTPLSDGESELSDSDSFTKLNARTKGVPIKLQLKRQYAEDAPSPDAESSNTASTLSGSSEEPLDMTTKRAKSDNSTLDMITAIPPGWIMNGLSREDHIKFQSAVSRASLSPYQKRSKSSDS